MNIRVANLKGIFPNMSNQEAYLKQNLKIQSKDVSKAFHIISSDSLTSVQELLSISYQQHTFLPHFTVSLCLCQTW